MFTVGSLFSGIGGIELGLQWAGISPVIWHVEINEHCQSVLKKHFPGAKLYADVKNVGKRNLDPVDLICGGYPCFPAGTLIDCPSGPRPIESLEVGDLVETHKHRYRQVVQTMSRDDAQIFEIRVLGGAPVQTTAEHPFLTLRANGPEWIRVVDLKRGDLIAQQLTGAAVSLSVPEYKPCSLPEFWRFVGRYLGDGWILDGKRTSKVPKGKRGSRVNSRVNKVIICSAHSESETVINLIRSCGFHCTVSKERTVTKHTISSKELVNFLRAFGRYAHGKFLPGWVYTLPADCLRELWEGYIDADGWKASKFEQVKKLAQSMARVGRIVFNRPILTYCHPTKSHTVIEGRTVQQRNQYQIRRMHATKHYGYLDDRYCWVPVRSVTDTGTTAKVFNIGVEDDESYISDSFAVHNCQELSGASAKKGPGLLGERSGLWFEYSRIISELRPRWVVIENVRSGANRWVDEVEEGLAKHRYESLPIPISAFDVGAPHLRQRVFIIARNVDADGNVKPMVQKYEKMARLQESPRDLSCWSRPPRIRVADGISKKMAAYGNAVVPQCAEVIGNIIKEIEKENDTNTLWKR